jgi:hypothetical protein
MPSQALQNLNQRMQDIEQLLQAHTVLTQFQLACRAAQRAGGELNRIAEIIGNLVNRPGRGRRTEVGALNRAAMVLLSAHLQGFVEDLHSEAANIILAGKVANIERVIENAKPRNFNPHADIIEKIFGGIGLYEIIDGISWQKTSNSTVKRRLTAYIQIRNKIAHGAQESVTKVKVNGFKDFVEHFAQNLDEAVAIKIQEYINVRPW